MVAAPWTAEARWPHRRYWAALAVVVSTGALAFWSPQQLDKGSPALSIGAPSGSTPWPSRRRLLATTSSRQLTSTRKAFVYVAVPFCGAYRLANMVAAVTDRLSEGKSLLKDPSPEAEHKAATVEKGVVETGSPGSPSTIMNDKLYWQIHRYCTRTSNGRTGYLKCERQEKLRLSRGEALSTLVRHNRSTVLQAAFITCAPPTGIGGGGGGASAVAREAAAGEPGQGWKILLSQNPQLPSNVRVIAVTMIAEPVRRCIGIILRRRIRWPHATQDFVEQVVESPVCQNGQWRALQAGGPTTSPLYTLSPFRMVLVNDQYIDSLIVLRLRLGLTRTDILRGCTRFDPSPHQLSETESNGFIKKNPDVVHRLRENNKKDTEMYNIARITLEHYMRDLEHMHDEINELRKPCLRLMASQPPAGDRYPCTSAKLDAETRALEDFLLDE
mmetsp:Transcript_11540/g.33329  ORF Transcript_11540/g.33329 Transcript_11540/m.33329 type:complete len:443 (-) Transcript_11540:325-1653(-)